MTTRTETEEEIIDRFKAFLKIPTVSTTGVSSGAYAACVSFLEAQAQDMGLPCCTCETVAGKKVVVITWSSKGTTPSSSGVVDTSSAPPASCDTSANASVLLNCHYDVVPVVVNKWTTPPFAAHEKANGDIVARGSQDMKCVGMQYLEAIRRLREQGKQPQRDVHVVFVPDGM